MVLHTLEVCLKLFIMLKVYFIGINTFSNFLRHIKAELNVNSFIVSIFQNLLALVFGNCFTDLIEIVSDFLAL